jgi:hypothetical protein
VKSHFGITFNSDLDDAHLYGIAVIALTAIINAKIPIKSIAVEEIRIRKTYLYLFNVGGLIAYMGRDAKTSKITYLMQDEARISWARAEGFFDDPEFTREKAFERIGVMRKLPNINEFVNFLARKPFEGIGPYMRKELIDK